MIQISNDPNLEAMIAEESARRGDSSPTKTAKDLLRERLTELRVTRRSDLLRDTPEQPAPGSTLDVIG